MTNFNELVKRLQKQLQNEPDNACLRNELAIALMEINDFAGAFFQLEKAAAIQPHIQSLNNLAYFYYYEGESLGEGVWRKKEKEAIRLLQKAIQYRPSSHIPYSLLGEIYAASGRYREAKKVLQTAVAIQPTWQNLNNLGVCYYKTGFLEKAAEHFSLSNLERKEADLSLYPLLNYGVTLAQLGRREEARQLAKRLLDMNEEVEEGVEVEVAHIYYIMGDYVSLRAIYDKLQLLYYTIDDIAPYFFALKQLDRCDEMKEIAQSIIHHKLDEMKATLADDGEWEYGRKEEYINELKEDIAVLENLVERIMEGEQPVWKYEPIIESDCYLFGCKRHGNPNYAPC
ncbi:tetratricopeptide repeat protein [Anoxybacteroides tepidamans]|uniref:tetratricopeptide repeat protein n=1 Tax=Anoxybacteroides tepidamans TaxID=265948 RepID=UPI00048510B3|nr:tetratricopeptide repeat protein [Anoxybacillus tepidamans]